MYPRFSRASGFVFQVIKSPIPPSIMSGAAELRHSDDEISSMEKPHLTQTVSSGAISISPELFEKVWKTSTRGAGTNSLEADTSSRWA